MSSATVAAVKKTATESAPVKALQQLLGNLEQALGGAQAQGIAETVVGIVFTALEAFTEQETPAILRPFVDPIVGGVVKSVENDVDNEIMTGLKALAKDGSDREAQTEAQQELSVRGALANAATSKDPAVSMPAQKQLAALRTTPVAAVTAS
jgi:hypothetical protein